MGMGHALTRRILSRLESAETHELNPHFRDDYRIAWITTLYAGRGDAMAHVLATYAVLRLHPDKVWPAIVARRKAQLGAAYERFYPPSPASVRSLALPPKKPVQSVRLVGERERQVVGIAQNCEARAKGIASSPEKLNGPGLIRSQAATKDEKPPNMASSARSYPNSNASTSRKSPHTLVARVRDSALHPRRRVVLVAMLEEFNAFAVVGSSNQLYPSQRTVSVAVGLPYITVRRAIDRMVEEQVLVQVIGSNMPVKTGKGWEFRRPATYQVNEEKLTPRETIEEYKHRRYAKKDSQSVTSPESGPQNVEAQKPAAAAPSQHQHHRSTERESRQLRELNATQAKELMQKIVALEEGCAGKFPLRDGTTRVIEPGDPDYIAPLDRDSAIRFGCEWICARHGVAMEKALEVAANAGYKLISEKGGGP
jgi:hypothetical protein